VYPTCSVLLSPGLPAAVRMLELSDIYSSNCTKLFNPDDARSGREKDLGSIDLISL
jgi:hypothetical protein